MKSLSHVQLFSTPWTVAYHTPPSMGFSKQEYWSGLPFPSPGDLPNPGIEPGSPVLQADALPSEPPGKSIRVYSNARFSYLMYHRQPDPLREDTAFESESEVAQLCPTTSDPMNCSPPGSSVHEISQARLLEQVNVFSSRGSSQPRD